MEPKPINTRAYIAMYMHDKTIATTNYYVHSSWKGYFSFFQKHVFIFKMWFFLEMCVYIAMYMHDKTIATTNYYVYSGWKGFFP